MFDSGSSVWEEREFSLRQSHEAVSQRMAAQQTDTHKVQAHYIIFYGTYATSMPAHPPMVNQKLLNPLHQGEGLHYGWTKQHGQIFLLLVLSLLPQLTSTPFIRTTCHEISWHCCSNLSGKEFNLMVHYHANIWSHLEITLFFKEQQHF